jgi:hypothetical protein
LSTIFQKYEKDELTGEVVRNITSVEEESEVINNVMQLLSKGDNNTLLPSVNNSLKKCEICKRKARSTRTGEDEENRRTLLHTGFAYEAEKMKKTEVHCSPGFATRSDERKLLACYAVLYKKVHFSSY